MEVKGENQAPNRRNDQESGDINSQRSVAEEWIKTTVKLEADSIQARETQRQFALHLFLL